MKLACAGVKNRFDGQSLQNMQCIIFQNMQWSAQYADKLLTYYLLFLIKSVRHQEHTLFKSITTG